jgi:hypothetical protein
MPNRFTRGKALVGALSVDADLTVLRNLQVTGDVTFQSAGSIPAPVGTTVEADAEARTAIGSIIAILQAVGLSD